METLRSLFADSSFLANVFLLLLGAALTGFLVPVVKGRLDNASAERTTIATSVYDRLQQTLPRTSCSTRVPPTAAPNTRRVWCSTHFLVT